jgi:prepilin-type N-terminal cleavage/methylation domain-containing protein
MKRCNRLTRPGFRRHAARGFTMLELVVASAISLLVLSGVMTLQYLSARTAAELYGPTDSRSQRMNALNQIRMRLVEAKVGSCVVSDFVTGSTTSGHRIRFVDPNMAGATSEFYFNPTMKTLYYNANVASGSGSVVARGPINILFTLGSLDLDPLHKTYMGTDGCVTLYVLTEAALAYSKVDTRDGETVVFLRNPVAAL